MKGEKTASTINIPYGEICSDNLIRSNSTSQLFCKLENFSCRSLLKIDIDHYVETFLFETSCNINLFAKEKNIDQLRHEQKTFIASEDFYSKKCPFVNDNYLLLHGDPDFQYIHSCVSQDKTSSSFLRSSHSRSKTFEGVG